MAFSQELALDLLFGVDRIVHSGEGASGIVPNLGKLLQQLTHR
ncbi:MAG: hypothetical protein ACLQLC_04800 [Candidatus Sulfotelmatobacter sp.]